jgi:hypothetical protein
MLNIRPGQMEAFEQAAQRRFENDMAAHLRKFAPRHCKILDEEALRTIIRLGIERARKYGFTNVGPVRLFLELMFLFGSDFDTDPQLPWAAEVLADKAIKDQASRAESLYAKTTDFLGKVAGPDQEYAKDALRRALEERFEELPIPEGDFENGMLARLEMMYSRKCQHVGDEVLRSLIWRSYKLTARHSAAGDIGAALFVELMFFLGHGCVGDPLFPWIAAALNDAAASDPEARARRLHAAWVAFLNQMLTPREGQRRP